MYNSTNCYYSHTVVEKLDSGVISDLELRCRSKPEQVHSSCDGGPSYHLNGSKDGPNTGKLTVSFCKGIYHSPSPSLPCGMPEKSNLELKKLSCTATQIPLGGMPHLEVVYTKTLVSGWEADSGN